jgi:hypothetical protein
MRIKGGRVGGVRSARYQIVAIDVLLAFNLAVVFILMYFRFRPSKAKSIGNVLTNRQNAANCCLHRVKEIC